MAGAERSYRGRSVKGMRDLLPPETTVWAEVEAIARRVFHTYAFEEIRTPIVEETELFIRGVGSGSEIVGKQMYTFADKKGKSLCLRPENTAPVARAFVEHGCRDSPLPVRWFYIGPQFRYERPQKGRYRQFHQIGAELIGDEGPWSDVEIILLLMKLLGALGFDELQVLINTVGDRPSRASYAEVLRGYLQPLAAELSEDSRRRLGTNPLRILDSKRPEDRRLLEAAPRIADHLSGECRAHFDDVLAGLDSAGVGYEIDERLVRGLDYYTKTVFEIVSSGLGAQNAIVGGGRYDGLIAEVGGDDLAGIGFAIGLDRLIELLPDEQRSSLSVTPPVLVVAAGEVSPLEAMKVAEELRSAGLAASSEIGARSMKAALRRANRLGIDYVVLIGDDEIAKDVITVRDFRAGEQRSIARGELAEALRELQAGGAR